MSIRLGEEVFSIFSLVSLGLIVSLSFSCSWGEFNRLKIPLLSVIKVRIAAKMRGQHQGLDLRDVGAGLAP